MFVGDRGYGVGSTIKGHAVQGDPWKQKKKTIVSTLLCV